MMLTDERPIVLVFQVLELVWDLYMRSSQDLDAQEQTPEAEDLARELIISLLQRGLKANDGTATGTRPHAGTLAGTPLGVLFSSLDDPELIDAFLAESSEYDTQGRYIAVSLQR